MITNKLNGKIYVGKHSTNNLDDGYMGSGHILCFAKKKYGLENFTKEYLAFCDNEETLNYLEKFYIKKYKAKEVGYNLSDGGDGVLGYHHTNEAKIKISKGAKGRVKSPEECKKLSESKKGSKNPAYKDGHRSKYIEHEKKPHIPWNKGTKGVCVAWNKGKKGVSEETRLKMSIAAKNRKYKKSL